MAFHVGQKVAQIRPWPNPHTYYPDVRFTECGVEYTIRQIIEVRGIAALYFMELRNPPKAYAEFPSMEQCFPAYNFRPIVERKTDISIFTAMLNPKKRSLPSERIKALILESPLSREEPIR